MQTFELARHAGISIQRPIKGDKITTDHVAINVDGNIKTMHADTAVEFTYDLLTNIPVTSLCKHDAFVQLCKMTVAGAR